MGGSFIRDFSFLLLICNQQLSDVKINGWNDSKFIIIIIDVLISTWVFSPLVSYMLGISTQRC